MSDRAKKAPSRKERESAAKEVAAKAVAAAAQRRETPRQGPKEAPKLWAVPPKGARCQEASPLAKTRYIACGTPATRVVTWMPHRSETYVMCTGCADHSVANRQARLVEKGESYQLSETASAPHRADETVALSLDADVQVEEAPAEQAVTDEQRKSVAERCAEAVALQAQIAQNEAVVDEQRARLRQMLEVDLVSAIKGIGQKQVPLLNGAVVKLKELKGGYIKADAPDDPENPRLWKTEAHAELERIGDGDLIKRQVIIEFTKGDDAWFKKFMRDNEQRKKPLNLTVKEAVNPQTFSAWVREQLRTGADIDRELFGVFEIERAEIVIPKERKAQGGM